MNKIIKAALVNKKPFFAGIAVGVFLTIAAVFVVGFISQTGSVKYLDRPVSYEGKEETSFKVFQVLGENSALAREKSDNYLDDYSDDYLGNIVVLKGKDFYTDQVITVEKPQRTGTFNYTNKADIPQTVPIIEGKEKTMSPAF